MGVGDSVRQGQALATVESNVSLAPYTITSPIDGVVLARSAAVGEVASNAPLFEIADLSALWVDVHLFGGDAQHIVAGLPIEVTRLSDGVSASTALDRVLPATATASQSTVGRARIDNADGRWRPGAAVRARVTVAEHAVPLAVPLAALQRFRDWDVVFVRIGDDYEIRPLELGRRDGVHVEVLDGLKAGDEIVVQITKEAIREKGPVVSGWISLPGRHLVLLQTTEGAGVSRRIEDPAQRNRLKSLLGSLAVPEGCGYIVRTEAAQATDDEIRLDAEFLGRLWSEIAAKAAAVRAPACLYQEADAVLRTLRDLAPGGVEAIIIDNSDLYDEARAFVQAFAPEVVIEFAPDHFNGFFYRLMPSFCMRDRSVLG